MMDREKSGKGKLLTNVFWPDFKEKELKTMLLRNAKSEVVQTSCLRMSGARNHINVIGQLYRLQLQTMSLKCEAVIIILITPMQLKGKFAAIIRGCPPSRGTFKIGVARMLMSFIDQMKKFSGKGVEFQFVLV